MQQGPEECRNDIEFALAYEPRSNGLTLFTKVFPCSVVLKANDGTGSDAETVVAALAKFNRTRREYTSCKVVEQRIMALYNARSSLVCLLSTSVIQGRLNIKI